MRTTAVALELPKHKTRIAPLLQILGASLFIGLCAQIKIPLYFTPVPVTGQTFAVILIASVLHRRYAVWATLLYLMEGAMGLPVFAGGTGGLYRFFGPTAGYLLFYPLQAFLVSYFMEKQKSVHFFKTSMALFVACCFQLAFGSLWLSHFVGAKYALAMGFSPFLAGEALKSLIVSAYVSKKHL